MDEAFQYTPLDLTSGPDGTLYFRVLEIHPALKMTDDIISCTLLQSSLRPRPEKANCDDDIFGPQHPYETISYAWGDASMKVDVRVNGQLLEVARSSELALRRIQLPDKPRIVWIDAICINQMNLQEKAHQVALMARLYSHGTNNLVYLAADNGSGASAVATIRLLLATEITFADPVFMSSDYVSERAARHLEITSIPFDEPALAAFFSCSWFKRLWVQQEIALSQRSKCLYGPFEMSLVDVLTVAYWLFEKSPFRTQSLWDMKALQCASIMFEYLETPWSKFRKEVRPPLAILNSSRNFACSEPRDKVYGTLGLFGFQQNYLPPEWTPNYTLPLAEVLTRAINWIIRKDVHGTQTTRILNKISHRSHEDIHAEGLASWVPRWFRSRQAGLDARQFRRWFSSGINRDFPSRVDPSSPFYSCWHVQGIHLGEVSRIIASPTIFGWSSFYTCYSTALRSLQDSEHIDLVLFEILTANPRGGRIDKELFADFADWLEQFAPGSDASNASDTQTGRDWKPEVQDTCTGRSIGTTNTSTPALFPNISRRGDHIVWIYGADHPTVLRPHDDDFEVIGQAFLSGMREEMIERPAWKRSKAYSLI